jgi:hypothetical protein
MMGPCQGSKRLCLVWRHFHPRCGLHYAPGGRTRGRAPPRFLWRSHFAEGRISDVLTYCQTNHWASDCLSALRPSRGHGSLRPDRFRSEAQQAFCGSADFGSGRSRSLPCSIMTDKARAHLKKMIDLVSIR